MIASQIDMHQSRNEIILYSVTIVVHPLNQR
jgi:hypothetical protein